MNGLRQRWARGTLAASVARAVALFFGLFSAVNAVVLLAGGAAEDLWWIDSSALWRPLAVLLGLAIPAALLAWGVKPDAGRRRALATAAVAWVIVLVALVNAIDFYRAWSAGSITPGVPVPLSLLIAVLFAWFALNVKAAASKQVRPRLVPTLLALVVLAAAFPLAQVLFFGTTDYRRPADDAVVFGALVHPSGILSQSLEDRVVTSAELHEEGCARRLIMSGGVGASGIDEAIAMKQRAVQLGVPAERILTDSKGVNTDATVRNTTPLFASGARVLVVSQFYHLPRIKLAYRAAGYDVQTVPAPPGRAIAKTPLFVVREIPGFWVYWARAAWREIGSGL